MKIEFRDPKSLIAYENNARTHSDTQIDEIVNSIKTFGFNVPITVGCDNVIIAGHARQQAAIRAGLDRVPVITLLGLDENARKAYILADNRIALNAGWNAELVKIEFEKLLESDFDLSLTGFTEEEIDAYLNPSIIGMDVGQEDEPELKEKTHICPACGHSFND